MIPQQILQLDPPFVLSVIGAGGKTTAIHAIADHFLALQKKVLVTTTTHMAEEPDRVESPEKIRQRLLTTGYAFAGTLQEKNGVRKMGPLPDPILEEAIPIADVTLIEADGSRRLPFKVPYPHEPVIHPATTHILLVAGMQAVGRPIREVVYHAEGLCQLLSVDPEEILTPEQMAEAYQAAYLEPLHSCFPEVPVYVCAGQDDTTKRKRAAECFLRAVRAASEEKGDEG